VPAARLILLKAVLLLNIITIITIIIAIVLVAVILRLVEYSRKRFLLLMRANL